MITGGMGVIYTTKNEFPLIRRQVSIGIESVRLCPTNQTKGQNNVPKVYAYSLPRLEWVAPTISRREIAYPPACSTILITEDQYVR